MNTLEGIIKDVENSELVSDKVLLKVIELIGLEKWHMINDEYNDIITTTGELLITLKNFADYEKTVDNIRMPSLKDKGDAISLW